MCYHFTKNYYHFEDCIFNRIALIYIAYKKLDHDDFSKIILP